MLLDIKIFRRKYFRNLFDVYIKETFVFITSAAINVHFVLEINSVILVYFSISSNLRVFLAFKSLFLMALLKALCWALIFIIRTGDICPNLYHVLFEFCRRL